MLPQITQWNLTNILTVTLTTNSTWKKCYSRPSAYRSNRRPVGVEAEVPGTAKTHFQNITIKPGNLEIPPVLSLYTPTVRHSTRLRPSAAVHDVVDSTRYSSVHPQQGSATKRQSLSLHKALVSILLTSPTQHALVRRGHAVSLRGRNKERERETDRNKLPPVRPVWKTYAALVHKRDPSAKVSAGRAACFKEPIGSASLQNSSVIHITSCRVSSLQYLPQYWNELKRIPVWSYWHFIMII
jgi:hypothetical protein